MPARRDGRDLLAPAGAGRRPKSSITRKPEASAEKTRGGWLRSGDIGHTDEEGWFFFDYRKGGGIRHNGDFVNPGFVEKVMAEHPDVIDVFVYGVPAASGAPGEKDVVAAIVVRQEAQLRRRLALRSLPAGAGGQLRAQLPAGGGTDPQDRIREASGAFSVRGLRAPAPTVSSAASSLSVAGSEAGRSGEDFRERRVAEPPASEGAGSYSCSVDRTAQQRKSHVHEGVSAALFAKHRFGIGSEGFEQEALLGFLGGRLRESRPLPGDSWGRSSTRGPRGRSRTPRPARTPGDFSGTMTATTSFSPGAPEAASTP